MNIHYKGRRIATLSFSTLQQFRSFCFQNSITDIEKGIEYFTVFGGMGWTVDTSKSLWELIEEKVLANYRYIHADITKITNSNKLYHTLLSALALGDGSEHTAFKKARVSRQEGEEAIDFLVNSGILRRQSSVLKPLNKDDEISDKLLFNQPFMRFWFASISPYYKGIKEHDFTEVKEKFSNREQGFSNAIYDQLVSERVKQSFNDDTVFKIGSYWDKHVEIDLVARTKSGKVIAGRCRYSNTKVKKSEITKLKLLCDKAELNPDIIVLFSKSGFSSELKNEKSEALRLFTLKSLKTLIEDLSPKDLLEYKGKRY